MSALPPVDGSGADASATSTTSGNIAQPLKDIKPRVMKRARDGVPSSSENSDESEPDEKRPTFRLQPPILIHGQAKPVPKAMDEEVDSSSKCKFLQPSRLTVPINSACSTAVETTSPVQPARTGSGPLVSSSNPFLMMSNKDGAEDTEDTQSAVKTESSFVFGSNLHQRAKVNGTASGNDNAQPDSTTGSDKKAEETTGHTGNLFLQPASNTSKENLPDGFVFGRKMEDRVTVKASSDAKSDEPDSGDNSTDISSSSFVFGQNLSDRAKIFTNTTQSALFAARPSAEADSSTSSGEKQNDGERPVAGGLEESAAAHFAASQARAIMPEVEVVTGEEDEKNVLQMQCKLYQFEAVSQNWLERGVGILHLNDGKCSDDDLHFQSRLVMRTHGSLRLVLNTKIWAQMTVEKASKKSVRVSAQTGDGTIGVFLLTATINDAEQIYRALEYRVLHQKQLEEKRKRLQDSEKKTEASGEQETSSSSDKNPSSDPPCNELPTSAESSDKNEADAGGAQSGSEAALSPTKDTEVLTAKAENPDVPAVSSTSDESGAEAAPKASDAQDPSDTHQDADSSVPSQS